MSKNLILDLHEELLIDLFAGGGGASTGIEMALGRHVDVAVNHDPEAVALHAMNHPQTRHLVSDVFEVDPLEVTNGRHVGLLWASPDCKHFSKAKGGKPVSKRVRSLAWVVVKWAKLVRPRVILLENVEEFKTWGPLCEAGTPCPVRKGQTFARWEAQLRNLGYQVEHKELRACDYGAPTIRKRLFLVARCDGQPIVWPAPTHGPGLRKPWRTAAECIDWSLPVHSIFMDPGEARKLGLKRPLAEATMKRIAHGVMKYVVNSAKPFIVNTRNGERSGQAPRTRSVDEPFWTVTAQGSQNAIVAPFLTEHANSSTQRTFDADEPLRTQVAQIKGGHFALVAAFLAKHYGGGCTHPAAPADGPMHTVTSQDHHSLVAANLIHIGHGEQCATGAKRWSHGLRDIELPLNTITASGAPAALVASHMMKLRGDNLGHGQDEPIHTISAQGNHFAEVRAFLVKYYGTDQDPKLGEPLHTVTTRDRFGLVTVAGEDYTIADIGMRMLTPRELYRAQGFPETYLIDRRPDGSRLSKEAQVRMCGNSVCPPIAAALVRANAAELIIDRRQAA